MIKVLQFLREVAQFLWRLPARIFGSRNERLIKQYSHAVAATNAFEPEMAKLSEAAAGEDR